jgi:hypothetical protein
MIYYLNLNATPNVANDGTEGSPWATFAEVGQNQTLAETDIVKIAKGFYDVSADTLIEGGVIYIGDGLVELDFVQQRFRANVSFASVKTEFNNIRFKGIKGGSGATDTAVNIGNADTSSDIIFRACRFVDLQSADEDQTALFGNTSSGGTTKTVNSLQILGCELDVTFTVAPANSYESNGIFAVNNTTVRNTTIVVNANSPIPTAGANFIFGVGGKGAWSHAEATGCSLIDSVFHGNNRLFKQFGAGGAPAAGGSYGAITNSGNSTDPLFVNGCLFWDIVNYEQSFVVTNITGIGTAAMRIYTDMHATQQAGDIITLKDVVGPTGINKSYTVITNLGAYLQVDGTGVTGSYTSGGTVVPAPSKEKYVNPKFIDSENINFDYLYDSEAVRGIIKNDLPDDAIWVTASGATGGDGSQVSPYGFEDATERQQAFIDAQGAASKTIAFKDGEYDIGGNKIQYPELNGVTLQSENTWGATLHDNGLRMSNFVVGGSDYTFKNIKVQPRDSIFYYSPADDTVRFKGCLIKGFDDTDVMHFQFGSTTYYEGCTIFSATNAGVVGLGPAVHVLGCTFVNRGTGTGAFAGTTSSTVFEYNLLILYPGSTTNSISGFTGYLTDTNLADSGYTVNTGSVRIGNIKVADAELDNIDVLPTSKAITDTYPQITAGHWFAPSGQGQGLADGSSRDNAEPFSQAALNAAYDAVGNGGTIAFRGDLGSYVLTQSITWNNAVTEYSNVVVTGEEGTVFDGNNSFYMSHRGAYTLPCTYENFTIVKTLSPQRAASFTVLTTSTSPAKITFNNVHVRDKNAVNQLTPAFGYINGGSYFHIELNYCTISNLLVGAQDYIVGGDEAPGGNVTFVCNNCAFHVRAGSVAGSVNHKWFRNGGSNNYVLNRCKLVSDGTGDYTLNNTSADSCVYSSAEIGAALVDTNRVDARPRFIDPVLGNFKELATSPGLPVV